MTVRSVLRHGRERDPRSPRCSPTAATASSGPGAGADAADDGRRPRRAARAPASQSSSGAGRRRQGDERRPPARGPQPVDRPVAGDRVQPGRERAGCRVERLGPVPEGEECLLHDLLSGPAIGCQPVRRGEDRPSRIGHRASRGPPRIPPPSRGRPRHRRSDPARPFTMGYVPSGPSVSSVPRSGAFGAVNPTASEPAGRCASRQVTPVGPTTASWRVPAGRSSRSPTASSTDRPVAGSPNRIEPRSTTMTLS